MAEAAWIKTIQKKSRELSRDFLLSTKFGAELEFYAYGKSADSIILKTALTNNKIAVFEVKKEEGKNQFEIIFAPQNNPTTLAEEINKAKNILKKHNISIRPKPYTDQPGCGLHIHVSLYEKNNKNIFVIKPDYLNYTIGGLLETLPASMPYFSPTKASYKRFEKNMHTPNTISWGGNNRTVAIRIPTSTNDTENMRLEHRVPSNDANPYAVIACIITSLHFGIKNKITPKCEKTYGNAFDSQYQLELLPQTYEQAKQHSHPIIEEIHLA